MKNIILLILLLSLPLFVISQSESQQNNKIKWLTIEEAEKLQEENPKTILIDMYTDWCGWCKKLDAETFSHPSVVNYVNENFYPVKFNAERTDTVVYRGNTYVNNNASKRSSHQLAQQLMGGKMSYPTIVYIDSDFRINPVPGYMDVKSIEPLLVYFAEKVNKTSDYAQFQKDFNNAFAPDSTSNISGNIEWMDFEETLELIKHEPKKVLLFLNSDYANSSKIMLESVLKHPIIAEAINDKFYASIIDFDTSDTIYFQGNIFINEKKIKGYPNQLTIALLQPELILPAIVFIDEQLRLVSVLKGYYPPQIIERFVEYIGRGLYLEEVNWEEYYKNFDSKLED